MGRTKLALLTDGLDLDVNALILRFIATDSVRYEEFARVWRELNYPLIFFGLKDETFQHLFTSEAFATVAKYLLPPLDLQTRICGLYTLYAMYYTQPCSTPVKIRVDPPHWEALHKLYADVKEQGHIDSAYIFLKLRKERAFEFVTTLRPITFDKVPVAEDAYDKWKAGRELLNTTFDPDLLEQLHNVHNQYLTMKKDMGLQNNLSLNLVRESMADHIVQRIHAHQPSDEDEDESENEPEANPAQEKAARIAMIKKKSMETKGMGTMSQRHIDRAVSQSSETEHDAPSPPKKRGRRGRKKMPGRRGRKPFQKGKPVTELDKKKAWSILPMRPIIDPQEDEEKDGDDEDSDSEPEQNKTKKVNESKTKDKESSEKGKKAGGKKEKEKKDKTPSTEDKKLKKKKKRENKSDTGDATTGPDEAISGTDEMASPKKKNRSKKKKKSSKDAATAKDRKKKRKSSEMIKETKKDRSEGRTGDEETSEVPKKRKRDSTKRVEFKAEGGSRSEVSDFDGLAGGGRILASLHRFIGSSDDAAPSPRKRGRGRPPKRTAIPYEEFLKAGGSIFDEDDVPPGRDNTGSSKPSGSDDAGLSPRKRKRGRPTKKPAIPEEGKTSSQSSSGSVNVDGVRIPPRVESSESANPSNSEKDISVSERDSKGAGAGMKSPTRLVTFGLKRDKTPAKSKATTPSRKERRRSTPKPPSEKQTPVSEPQEEKSPARSPRKQRRPRKVKQKD